MNTGIECRHEKFPGYSLDLNQRGQFSILQEESLKQSESQPYKKIISGLKNENYSIPAHRCTDQTTTQLNPALSALRRLPEYVQYVMKNKKNGFHFFVRNRITIESNFYIPNNSLEKGAYGMVKNRG